MKCTWCGNGEGRGHVYDKKLNRYMYYVCSKCVGFIGNELDPIPSFLKFLKQIFKTTICMDTQEAVGFKIKEYEKMSK